MERWIAILTFVLKYWGYMKLDVKSMLERRYGKGRVPRLLLWYLRRLFHEDFVNDFLEKGYAGPEFCDKALDYIGVTLQVEVPTPLSPTILWVAPTGLRCCR